MNRSRMILLPYLSLVLVWDLFLAIAGHGIAQTVAIVCAVVMAACISFVLTKGRDWS